MPLLPPCRAGSLFCALLLTLPLTSPAGDETPLLDSIWNSATLSNDPENSVIQEFALVGRYHGQYWHAETDDNEADDWENRRFYLGFNTRFLEHFTLEVQASLSDNFDPVYKSLYDAYLKWDNPDGDLAMSVGRLDYVFTGMERSTSSKKIKTIERALLVNQLMPGEAVGIYLKGGVAGAGWHTGLFSGSIEDEFTDFEGGYAGLLGVNFSLPLIYDNGTLHLDYLYNDGDEDNNAFKPYQHIVTLWHDGEIGSMDFGIDMTWADGLKDQSDVFGLTLLTSWDFASDLLLGGDQLQLVARYHLARSESPFGLDFAKRYEQEVVNGRGDSYNSIYLGLNYYIYDQKLKLMAGAEHFDMEGYSEQPGETSATGSQDGFILSAGLRLYF